MLDEYPQLVNTLAARLLAARTFTFETFLRQRIQDDPQAFTPRAGDGSLLYHAHCHQKALVGTSDAHALLKYVWNDAASEMNTGCCGMAGSFGHEKGHYEIARAIGEERLFPAVRERGGASIAVSGFSCLQQIEHHTGAQPKHLVEYLADALL